jgi:hypothetical protein
LGWLVISQANNNRTWPTRQIFYAKYIYWVVSFPAAVIALGLLSTVSWASIAYNVVLCWVWVISYLVAAFTPTNYKWGFFAIGTVAWLVLAFGTFTDGRKAANRSGVGRDFTMLAAWSNLLWLNYMIAWVISDGVNRIGITQMFIYFGILDGKSLSHPASIQWGRWDSGANVWPLQFCTSLSWPSLHSSYPAGGIMADLIFTLPSMGVSAMMARASSLKSTTHLAARMAPRQLPQPPSRAPLSEDPKPLMNKTDLDEQ